MSAPQAVVDAVMEALGCQPYTDPYPYCRTSHGRGYVWTDRGCGIAVAAADAAHKAALPHLLAPIEALHRPRDVQAITARDCVHEVCGHEDACPTSPVTTCAHCWDIAESEDAYFAERGIPEEVRWPCATAAALASIKGQPS